MTTQPSDKPTMFESDTCTRCGGTGHYSRCQMYGTTCFKCGGRGRTLTKRGDAAQQHFRNACSKSANDLVVGDIVLVDVGLQHTEQRWVTVTEISGMETEPSGWTCDPVTHEKTTPHFHFRWRGVLKNGTKYGASCFPDSMLRVAQTNERRAELIAASKAYQDTLTKRGTVRKRIARV